MEESSFFKWIGRLNSVLFLLLLVLSIGFLLYGIIESNKWEARNSVEITDNRTPGEAVEDLRSR